MVGKETDRRLLFYCVRETMFDLTIKTERLTLRPFRLEDAPHLYELANAWGLAKMTARIPHPYPVGLAAKWSIMLTWF